MSSWQRFDCRRAAVRAGGLDHTGAACESILSASGDLSSLDPPPLPPFPVSEWVSTFYLFSFPEERRTVHLILIDVFIVRGINNRFWPKPFLNSINERQSVCAAFNACMQMYCGIVSQIKANWWAADNNLLCKLFFYLSNTFAWENKEEEVAYTYEHYCSQVLATVERCERVGLFVFLSLSLPPSAMFGPFLTVSPIVILTNSRPVFMCFTFTL